MKLFYSWLLFIISLFCIASDNLDYGIPGYADQIIDREGYALGYCEKWELPRWVSYRLTAKEVTVQQTRRIDNFQPDPEIITGSASLEDYKGSGYDRGHMAPAADMKWSPTAMNDSFYLSNMCPQNHECNSGIWNEIENTTRGFACSEGSVFVITGPVVSQHPQTIGRNQVAVPDGFYKVVYDETPPCKMIAFYVPNRPISGSPEDYVHPVEFIEKITGLTFFPNLREYGQELKCATNIADWNWSKSQKSYAVRQNSDKNREYFSSDYESTGDNIINSNDAYFSSQRKEYRAGNIQPVGSRVAAPVCEDWPETGYWLSTNSSKRHNRHCENYRKTSGYPCSSHEGMACKKCGG